MKTHHFILKEDGNIYVIPEIGNAKESALLVENQKEVTAKIVESSFAEDSFHPFEFKVGQLYPLECGIEVMEIRIPCPDGIEGCVYHIKHVALITFSEPSKEVVEEPTQEELWISVDERLPKLEGRYLTYRSNGIMIVEHWYKKDSKFLWGNCYGVTHWMPIKPPITKKAP